MTRRKEAGQALIFVALALPVLLGFVGLGIDMGVVRYERRLQQTAADSGAIAGASNLVASSGGVTAGAQGASATNGFTDNGGGNTSACTAAGAAVGTVCVQVNNPPASGPNAGNNKYVEVLVAAVHPTYFMQLLGTKTATVTARAVATNDSGGGPGSGCVYTLGPPSSTIQGVNIQGHADLNAPTCGIVGNGNFDPTGGAFHVNAGTFSVAGACSGSGCGKGSVTCADQAGPCPATGAPAAANPLASLTPPAVGTPQTFNTSNIMPGTYTSISLTGNGTYTFPAGIYVLDGAGGFTCNGTPTINGTGVMFYFTNGATFSCTGNDTINLTAPSPTNCTACASEYDGILMYQDPADTVGPSLGGNTGAAYNGALYFPKSQVTFFGNNTSVAVGMVVSDAIALSGNPTVNLEGSAGLGNLGLTINTIKTAILVE